jgi:hypothetical protein
MREILCQWMYSDRLSSNKGQTYFEALEATALRVRPWSRDEFDASPSELRDACDQGQRIIVELGDQEWIASADWKTGTLNLTGDLPVDPDAAAPLQQIVHRVTSVLEPRFGWADVFDHYPAELVQSVLDTDIRWLFWLNVYGPRYEQKYGSAFFLEAPFIDVITIGDAVSCTVSDSPGAVDRDRVAAITEYYRRAGISTAQYGA